MHEAEFPSVDYDVREWSEYINSPANDIRDGAAEVRENLELVPRWVAGTLPTMTCERRA
jgi:adenylate cyclase